MPTKQTAQGAVPSTIRLPLGARVPAISVAHPAQVQGPKTFYEPELDSLRFLAFLGVFLFHTRSYVQYAGLSPELRHLTFTIDGVGSFGVDLFFVLSAYLITTLLLREQRATGNLNVPAFYLRRILRIWPLYFFFLGVACLWPLMDGSSHLGWKYLAGYLLLAGNWVTILLGVPRSVAHPLWSISMEEQFYLCWPPLVKRLSIQNMSIAAIIMLFMANAIRLLLYVFVHPINQSIWFNTFTRLDPIALGILLALLLVGKKIELGRRERILLLGVSLLALTGVSAFGNLDANLQPMTLVGVFSYPVAALGCAGILLAMRGVSTPMVCNDKVIYLGKISYGLYVYHILGLSIAEHLLGPYRSSFQIGIGVTAGLCLTIILAIFSYTFLEAPFLRWKKHFTYVPSRPV